MSRFIDEVDRPALKANIDVSHLQLADVPAKPVRPPVPLDDVVPFEHSISFAALHHVELYLLDGNHALDDVLPRLVADLAA